MKANTKKSFPLISITSISTLNYFTFAKKPHHKKSTQNNNNENKHKTQTRNFGRYDEWWIELRKVRRSHSIQSTYFMFKFHCAPKHAWKTIGCFGQSTQNHLKWIISLSFVCCQFNISLNRFNRFKSICLKEFLFTFSF